mgnify:CR=1 FL=1
MFKEKIIREMKVVFKEIPFGIDHTLKVLQNAEESELHPDRGNPR